MQIKEIVAGIVSEHDPLENKDSISVAPTPRVQVKEPTPVSEGTAEHTSDGSSYFESVDPLISNYADKIEEDPHEINNYPLYRFIDKWYGTRYKWGGSDLTGIDCSAFAQKLYGSVYSTEIVRTARQQHRSCDEIIKDYDEANEGDLVFFRIHHIRVSHVGVYLANGYFVHASRSQGVVISNLNSRYWRRRYAGCGRVQKESKAPMETDYSVTPTQ